jgi:mRNA interferase MazF
MGLLGVLDQEIGRKPYLVVSNNRGNRNLPSVLAVRITTSNKPEIPSVVALGAGDPLVGSVLCDEVGPLWEDEVQADAGALSPTSCGPSKPACMMPSDG